MAIRVQIFDENGRALSEGLAVELVKNREVVATAAIGAEGVVVFESDAAPPLAVRLAPARDCIQSLPVEPPAEV